MPTVSFGNSPSSELFTIPLGLKMTSVDLATQYPRYRLKEPRLLCCALKRLRMACLIVLNNLTGYKLSERECLPYLILSLTIKRAFVRRSGQSFRVGKLVSVFMVQALGNGALQILTL